MYFTNEELEISLPIEAKKRPAKWVRDTLKILDKSLSNHSSQYKVYGAYWWELKRILKRHFSVNKRRWFLGPYDDFDARQHSNHGSDILNIHAALRYEKIQSQDPVWLERDESAWHICEWSHGFVELYRLSDTDAGHQLDLFENAEITTKKLERYLNSIVEFLPRTWRTWGDTALRNGDADRAAACYKRMTLLAGNSMDRTEGWLLQGMTFDHKAHYHKAIFCYMNLYEKGKQHWVLGNIAASYTMAGEYHKAFEYYTQALFHMPGNPEFEAGLRSARQKLGFERKLLSEGLSA